MFLSWVAMNRDKSTWGEDSFEFKPDRWLHPEQPARSVEMPGVYSGMMTFLGGPRHCIGYRFAIMEMKVAIFVLLRQISFALPDQAPEIGKRSKITTKPVIKQPDGAEKSLIPLLLRPINSE